MKILGFDHTIIFVHSIEEASANFAALGFDVIKRPDAGESETDIRLICLADSSYLELFAFKDQSKPSNHRWYPLVGNGEGWVDYSLFCEAVAPFVHALNAVNVPATEPRSGGKSLLDGRAWKVGVVDAGFGIGNPTMPFFLEDLAPRENRVPPSGNPRLTTVGTTLVTDSIETCRVGLEAVLGAGKAIAPREPAARAALLFEVEDIWIELLEASPGDNNLSDHLKRHGQGLYEVTLSDRGKIAPGEGQLLPLNLTHGARLRLERGRS